MPITVYHSLTATTPDATSAEIRPSHWNQIHAASVVLSNNEVIKWVQVGTNSISSGTLQFSNSNNVSFGMDTAGVVTASASVAAGAGDGVNILAAGTQTANTTGTVVFSNSNGVTFGMSNNSVITASVAAGGMITHDSAYHSGNIFPGANQNFGTAYLDWGVTASDPTAPGASNVRLYAYERFGVPVVRYQRPTGFPVQLAQDNIMVVRNETGSPIGAFSVVYEIGTGAGGEPLIGLAQANSDTTMPALGITVEAIGNGSNGTIMIAGVLAGVNTSGFAAGDILYVSPTTPGAFTTTIPAHPYLRQRIARILTSAVSGTALILSRQEKGNEIGVSNNSWLIGDSAAGAKSVGFINANAGHLAWNPSANRTVYLPDGNGTLLTGVNVSAGTTSNNLSAVTFSNLNGVSFGLNGSVVTGSHNALTTARASNDAIGLNTALTAGPLAWTVNSSGLSLNAGSAAGTSSGFAGNQISGSMTHNTAGLNLSLNHPAWLTTAALSNHSHGNPTLALTNLSGTTASNSAGLTLSLSAAAPGAAAENNWVTLGGNVAGNSSASGSTIQWIGGDNVTLSGTNGSQVIISAGAGGAAGNQRWIQLPDIRASAFTNLTPAQSMTMRPFFIPFFIGNNMTISRGNWEMSRSTSGSNNFSVTMGIYTYVNDTQISLLTSFSGNFSNTATASISGIRRFGILASQSFSLSPGGYVFGMMMSAANTLSMNYSLRGYTAATQAGAILGGTDNYNTATSYNIFPFFGRYSTTTAAFPGSVADSVVIGQFGGASSPLNLWIGLNKD